MSSFILKEIVSLKVVEDHIRNLKELCFIDIKIQKEFTSDILIL
jgi:hypothetical protein